VVPSRLQCDATAFPRQIKLTRPQYGTREALIANGIIPEAYSTLPEPDFAGLASALQLSDLPMQLDPPMNLNAGTMNETGQIAESRAMAILVPASPEPEETVLHQRASAAPPRPQPPLPQTIERLRLEHPSRAPMAKLSYPTEISDTAISPGNKRPVPVSSHRVKIRTSTPTNPRPTSSLDILKKSTSTPRRRS